MKNKLIYRALLVLIFAFQGAAHAAQMKAADLSEAESQFDSWGVASVIVEFGAASISSQSLVDLKGAALKQRVGSMRTSFMATLPNQMASTVSHAYDYVPGIVSTVTKSQLELLRKNSLVKNIFANKQRKATLAESVGLVYPSKERLALDGAGWTTAIIDTGVHRGHSFFVTDGRNRVVSEACYSGGGFDDRFTEINRLCPGRARVSTARGSGEDCTGFPGCDHGTHVAGIAAGNGGVASGANIIAIQVFTGLRDVFSRDVCGTGVGDSCVTAFDSDIIAGLERVYALRNTYKIASVNMSLGGGAFSSSCNNENTLATNVVNRLKNVGIATTVSSGNDGFDDRISYPACISNAIAVGATSDFTGDIFGNPVTKDQRVFYSNNGATLDVYAPGTLIRSSIPNNGFSNFNGTSMAAPHIAGAYAVFRQAKPSATAAELETALKSVGPNVVSNGVSRRRLDVVDVLRELGVRLSPTMAPIMMLLDE